MANKRITELTSATTLTVNDLLVLVNDSQTRKATIETLLNFVATLEKFADLDENGKILASQLPDSIVGSLRYKGSWNAATNTPAIEAASAENTGWYYVVGTAGIININDIEDWQVGDWLVSNGTAWQKIDNSAVTSWNGRDGNVMPEAGDYTTDEVTEGTNQYFTEARVLDTEIDDLSTASTDAVADGDSVLDAIGKLQAQFTLKETAANKGANNGYASLDSAGKVPVTQLPASVLGTVSYQGSWDASANSPTIPTATTGNKGWYYVVGTPSDITTIDTISDWKVGDWIISNGSSWQKVDNTEATHTTTQVAEGTNLYFTEPRVLDTDLAGIDTSTTGAVSSSSTVLTGIGRLQASKEDKSAKGAANGYAGLDSSGKVPTAQLPDAILGSVVYKGSWNANTNSPSITTGSASSANKGWYYVVGTGSLSTTVDTISDWKIGDWIISNGTVWQKVDNTEAIQTTGDLPEGDTNQYFTPARVRGTFLDSINSSTMGTVSEGDTVLSGIGKLQATKASLDSGTSMLLKSQLTRGQKSIDLDFTGFTAAANTTNQLLYSCQIPASTLAAGDQLNISTWFAASNNANTKKVRMYLNTSASLTGATLIATLTVTTNSSSIRFNREVSFLTNTTMKAGVAATTSSALGENTTTMDAAITIPSVSAGFYVLVAAEKDTSGDTLKLERVGVLAIFG